MSFEACLLNYKINILLNETIERESGLVYFASSNFNCLTYN